MLHTRVRRGEMDREITFIQKIIGSNPTNEDEDLGWEKVDTDPDVFAKVVQKPGREVMMADRPTYVQNTHFYVDYRTDITEVNRIVYKGRVYNILSVTEYESSREMILEILAEILDNEVWT